MIRRIAAIALGILLMASGMSFPVAARADGSATAPVFEIMRALERVPGGVVMNERTAYWPEFSMTMTVPDERLRDSIGSCPHGSICAFSGVNLGGSRLAWTTCATHSTTALGAVASIANARTSGKLQARYGTTVRATAAAQSWASVTGSVDNVRCS